MEYDHVVAQGPPVVADGDWEEWEGDHDMDTPAEPTPIVDVDPNCDIEKLYRDTGGEGA